MSDKEFIPVRIAVLTVSDTRSLAEDRSGDTLVARIEGAGHVLADRKIRLNLDESAIQWLADKGYDPAYGARPLKRVMQKELQDPLAEKILLGEVFDNSTVAITAGSDRLVFKPARATVASEDEAA